MQDNSNEQWRLILASQSPRRREFLGHTKVPFEVVVSDVDEVSASPRPEDFCRDIALLKANAVQVLRPAGRQLIVASDTIVALGERIYGKPRDANEARTFLEELSGRTHQVHTAVVLLAGHHRFEHVETAHVTFMPIAARLLDNYLASGDSLDKAGAYGIQGQALTFIERLEGCFATVAGFPLARFCAMMEGPVKRQLGWTRPWQDYFR